MKEQHKNLLAKAGLGFIALPFAFVAITNAFAGSAYVPQYQTAHAAYEAQLQALCLQIKTKAAAKLEDDTHGVKFDSLNRDETAQYRDMDCSKVKIGVTVDFQ